MRFPPSHSLSPKPRVVITGVGLVTALGLDWETNAEGFRTGRRAFRAVTQFDVANQRAREAAEVDLPADLPATHLAKRQIARLDRASRMLLRAAHQAWHQAKPVASSELPIVLGTTSGGMSQGEAYYRQAIQHPHRRSRQPTRVLQYQAQLQAIQLANAFQCHGPITIIANACASGANAIGHAWSLIRQGHSAQVLTGGYDALSHLVFSGFDSLLALTRKVCRPFDAHRDGLALGEGAAVLILERLDHARQRGAEILGEVAGYGAVSDSYHLTQPHPNGDAALASMNIACATAGIGPAQVDYVNAHGTGTLLNDSAEANAIKRWAGEGVLNVRVSSTKASIGHLLGAAGAVETVVCLMSLRGQWLPPTSTVEQLDPLCAFQLVRKPTEARVDYALTNSFGFGGANASLVLRRWP